MNEYFRPTNIEALFDVLTQKDWKVLAGGTDYYPANVGKPLRDNLLDITAIDEFRKISETELHWRIGATATWTDIIRYELPPEFDGLKAAAKEVGGVQIQNCGTIGGNICNASPAADGITALLALDATVEVQSAQDILQIPIQNFVLGNRKIKLGADQIVSAILIPKFESVSRSGRFLKLGSRKYLVISLVMASAVLGFDTGGNVCHARVAVGACSETAQRLKKLETYLVGRPIDVDTLSAVDMSFVDGLTPIDDVRASRAYRQDVALTVIKRLLLGQDM